MENFKIVDWAGNTCFNDKVFESFDDAEEFLQITLNDNYDTDRQEYNITNTEDVSVNFIQSAIVRRWNEQIKSGY